MKKSLCIVICLSLLVSISTISSAQSNENEMFQFEQSRQFLGTWQVEAGENTTMTVSYEAWGMAMKYSHQMIRKLDDSGRFVSATKYIAEKYDGYSKDPKAIEEIVFKSPDKMLIRIKERGAKMARDAEWGPTITLVKVE